MTYRLPGTSSASQMVYVTVVRIRPQAVGLLIHLLDLAPLPTAPSSFQQAVLIDTFSMLSPVQNIRPTRSSLTDLTALET
jgi:hypothetical protein